MARLDKLECHGVTAWDPISQDPVSSNSLADPAKSAAWSKNNSYTDAEQAEE